MVYVRQKKNRGRIHCSISSAPLRDTAGKVTGVMVILEDITEPQTTPGRTAAVRRAVSRAGKKTSTTSYMQLMSKE